MVQNGTIVTHAFRGRGRTRLPGGRQRRVLPGLTCLLAAVALSAPQPSAQVAIAPAPATERPRLIAQHRQAVAYLQEVESVAPAADDADALGRLAGTLETLAAPQTPPILRDALVADLARAARRLRDAASRPAATRGGYRRDEHVDGASLKALLDRVKATLDGDVALGLTFQGSYSQSRAKDPVTGGHASAMGPAPAPAPAASGDDVSPVRFVERTTLPTRTWAGGPTKDHILESAGNGVALIDYDGDGWLDIYLVTAAQLDSARQRIPHRNALYRNLGGWRFEDVSAAAGVDAAAWGSGACAGDVDGDGRVDLYVTNWGPNLLYVNRGNGTFDERAEAAGVAAGGWSTGCAFLDADADGDLDLYVARYVHAAPEDLLSARRTLRWRNGPAIMVGPAGLPGEADLFFENIGGGRFRETSADRGLADVARAYGFGVVATDVDDDGAVDVFVANDSNPNFLYRNDGAGHFDSRGVIAGVGVNAEARAQAGMGVDAGDTDGDGHLDLLLTAFAHDHNTLYRNLGDGTFEDVSTRVGLATTTFQRMGWGAAFADVDLDGRLDLLIANGHIFADVGAYPALGEQFAQRNQLLMNAGGTFRDVSAAAGPGLQVEKVSRGLAVGDLDNDGDPDVVVSNMDDTPSLLENQQVTGHHWISIGVTAPVGNRLAIGARVTVTTAAGRQVREVRSGGSFMSQGDLRLQFGLGRHAGPADVEVRLPGGRRWRWAALPIDRLHALTLDPSQAVAVEERAK